MEGGWDKIGDAKLFGALSVPVVADRISDLESPEVILATSFSHEYPYSVECLPLEDTQVPRQLS